MPLPRHIEFLHAAHFEQQYHRQYVTGKLGMFIDFFWQTKFERLWEKYPRGFSDALFPNLGYTYLLNLGTPFVMQVNDQPFRMRTDGFLPRPGYIECFHQPGNVLFGIKFNVSPVLFEKKVDFTEYKTGIFPLSYLVDQDLVREVKRASGFERRVQLLQEYYAGLIGRYEGSLQPVTVVTRILQQARRERNFTRPVEEWAEQYRVSSRTLQRYFRICTGVNSKQALQILRIRLAVTSLLAQPRSFHYGDFGYYDYSHFFKHLRQFMHHESLKGVRPHLKLLAAGNPAP